MWDNTVADSCCSSQKGEKQIGLVTSIGRATVANVRVIREMVGVRNYLFARVACFAPT